VFGSSAQLLRRVVCVVAVVAVAGVFGACGDDDSGESKSPATTSTQSTGSTVADLSGKKIGFLGFGGESQKFMNTYWLEPFESESGAKFVVDSPIDYAKIKAQVEAGKVSYDIVDADPYVVDSQCGKYYEPVGVDMSGMQPQYQQKSECVFPGYVYNYVIASDPKAFPNGAPQNCVDFFDTEKFPGKRTMFSYYVSGIIECAAIAAGGDPKNLYPIDIDAAFGALEKIKKNIVFYDSVAQAADMVQNREVATGIFLPTSLRYAAEAGKGFEASTGWTARGVTAFGIPKGAPSADAAKAFLKYLTNPEDNRRFSDKGSWTYGSPYGGQQVPAKAKELGLADILPTSPAMDKVATDIDWSWWSQNVSTTDPKWTEFAQG
jgi:putative spermidine/putrescine transport system substrate-binding protein